jgi:hypothetical protein
LQSEKMGPAEVGRVVRPNGVEILYRQCELVNRKTVETLSGQPVRKG